VNGSHLQAPEGPRRQLQAADRRRAGRADSERDRGEELRPGGLLLDNGINVNVADYDGRTALHLAACCQHEESDLLTDLGVLSMLLGHGADISMKDRWGNTALDDAKKNDAQKAVEVLVAAPMQ
jgi:hypothetical protein